MSPPISEGSELFQGTSGLDWRDFCWERDQLQPVPYEVSAAIYRLERLRWRIMVPMRHADARIWKLRWTQRTYVCPLPSQRPGYDRLVARRWSFCGKPLTLYRRAMHALDQRVGHRLNHIVYNQAGRLIDTVMARAGRQEASAHRCEVLFVTNDLEIYLPEPSRDAAIPYRYLRSRRCV